MGAKTKVKIAATDDIRTQAKTRTHVPNKHNVNHQSNGNIAPNAVATPLPPWKLKKTGYI